MLCDFENEKGEIKKVLFGDLMCIIVRDTTIRFSFPIYALFHELYPYPMTSFCRRYKRNVATLRAALQKMIDDRRSGKTKCHFGEDGDLLGILLQNDLYRGNDEKTKDELVILFLAGNETIKTSSTNTVCYLTMDPVVKAKFMSEINPVLERCSDNFLEKLTIDEVESFDYVRRCWQESMRL